jgi:hypothetical protein
MLGSESESLSDQDCKDLVFSENFGDCEYAGDSQ